MAVPPEKFASRLNTSAGKVAALQCVLTKPEGGIGSIPTWVQKDWFTEVRLNLIKESSLIDGGNDQTINRHPPPDVVVQNA